MTSIIKVSLTRYPLFHFLFSPGVAFCSGGSEMVPEAKLDIVRDVLNTSPTHDCLLLEHQLWWRYDTDLHRIIFTSMHQRE